MSELLKFIKRIVFELRIIVEKQDNDLEKASEILGRRYNLDSATIMKIYKNNNR